jgi:hypothetical protein
MPKSNTKVIVLVAAVTFTAFLLLALPAIASDEQNPVGSRTAALTVQGGTTPVQLGGDPMLLSTPCMIEIGTYISCRLPWVPRPHYICEERTTADPPCVGKYYLAKVLHRKDKWVEMRCSLVPAS